MIRIELAKGFGSGGCLYAVDTTFDQSKWLGDRGWYFFGRRSNPEIARKMARAGVRVNSRWLPISKAAVAAQLLGTAGVEFSSAARAVVAPLAATQEASRATDAEINVPTPEGLAFRGYQRAGIAFALDAFERGQKGVLVADEMGLGKTMQGIGIAIATDAARILVVCPASLCINWQREIEKWWPAVRGQVQILTEGVDPQARIVILNYEKAVGRSARAIATRASLLESSWDLAIFDEAHMLKNPTAQRTRFFLGDIHRGELRAHGVAQLTERFVILTGTPIQNNVRESITLLTAIGAIGEGGVAETESKFLFRYCGAAKKWTGRKEVWTFQGGTHLAELQAKLRTGFMVRRLKADVAKELPPKLRSVVVFDRPKTLDALDEAAVSFEDDTMLLNGVTVAFEELSAYRAQLAGFKLAPVKAHVADLLEGGRKILVFCHHQAMLDGLQAAFGKSAIRIDGSTPLATRQDLVDRYQTDDQCRVALLSTHAAGVGLTLTAADMVVFAEADWNPSWCVQAEDRAHRIGQAAESVTVQYLTLDGTLDARVFQTMVGKMDVADRALDRRVVAEAAPESPEAAPESPEVAPTARKECVRGEEYVITEDRKAAAVEGLLYLSGRCDGAITEDGIGFNGRDASSPFVRGLVEDAAMLGAEGFSDRRAAWALKVLRTYCNTQLSHLADRLYPEEGEK